MKKGILISAVLSTVFCSGLIAEDLNLVNSKNVYIDIDTKPGAILLESEKEYKQYLIDKMKRTEEDNKRIAQLSKNCDDIAMLKAAVAKLITDGVDIKNSANVGINSVKDSLVGLEKRVDDLNETKQDKIIPKKVCKSNCTPIQVRVVNEEVLSKSYKKLNAPMQFEIAESTGVYKYPIQGSAYYIKMINAGEKISADMTTMGGWVHTSEGWISGYKLNPKFEYVKDVNGKVPSNLFIKKTIKKCENKGL